jgi:hypothetical protein
MEAPSALRRRAARKRRQRKFERREGKALTLQLGPASSTVGAISSTAATPPQQVLPRRGGQLGQWRRSALSVKET